MATYTKLRDGSWGVRVEGSVPKAGTTVTVSKKDGSSKTETLARLVWSGNGISLWATAAPKTPQAGRRRPVGDCDDFCQGCPRCW